LSAQWLKTGLPAFQYDEAIFARIKPFVAVDREK